MNYNSAGLNNLTDINSNVMNKFAKINHKNYKTISINSKAPSNYTKYNHSKDNIQQQQINNIQEKKRKNSNNKILNIKKIKDFIQDMIEYYKTQKKKEDKKEAKAFTYNILSKRDLMVNMK